MKKPGLCRASSLPDLRLSDASRGGVWKNRLTCRHERNTPISPPRFTLVEMTWGAGDRCVGMELFDGVHDDLDACVTGTVWNIERAEDERLAWGEERRTFQRGLPDDGVLYGRA